MHITLIGMSNIGKSHWANRLATETGHDKIDCDLLVEQKLGPELTQLGYAGIRDVAKWMGQPSDPQYAETSQKFIACERAVMQTLTQQLRTATKPFVIDTTGSVIYTGPDIAEQLRALTRVIYLEASPAHVAQLFDRYIAEPKPVIWGAAYRPLINEPPPEALKRCYPKLLKSRARCYKDLAHTIIPFETHRAKNADLKLTG